MRLTRPVHPKIVTTHPLAAGLVFAGLGGGAGTLALKDAATGNHGTLNAYFTPNEDWQFMPTLGRMGLANIKGASGVRPYVTTANPLVSAFPCSLSAWVYLDAATSGVVFWGTACQTQNRNSVFSVRENNYVYMYFNDYSAVSTETTVTNWHHWANVTDGLSAKFYKDGTLIATHDISSKTFTFTSVKNIGYSTSDDGGTCSIVDDCVWKRLLTATEIADLADPSNVYLSGLIAGRPKRRYFLPAAPAFSAAWALKTNNLIGGGVG